MTSYGLDTKLARAEQETQMWACGVGRPMGSTSRETGTPPRRRHPPAPLSAEEATTLPTFKRCAQCMTTKERAAFSWERRADAQKRRWVQLKGRCKACIAQAWRETMDDPVQRNVYRAYYARRRAARLDHERKRQAAWRRLQQRQIWDALVAPYVAAVCTEYGVTLETLQGPSRDLDLVQPRRVLIFLLATDAHQSAAAIGRLMHRDHSTVLHHVEKMRRYKNWEEREMVRDIKMGLCRYHGYRLPHPADARAARKAG